MENRSEGAVENAAVGSCPLGRQRSHSGYAAKSAYGIGAGDRRVEEIPGGARGPWELRRSTFRQGGQAHQLVELADLRRALRQEERQAWQRLVRVLGDEINNSLTPIVGIVGDARGQALHEARHLRAPAERRLAR